MKFVRPIRDKGQIESMKKALKAINLRDYVLFVLGINTGMPVCDLLQLKQTDVKDEEGRIKYKITICDDKNGQVKSFSISDTVTKALQEYLPPGPPSKAPLFPSRKGSGSITRQQAYLILNKAARRVGITEPIGTHTLRKTFGYHARMAGYPIETLQEIFNHPSKKITCDYLGITKDDTSREYMELNL